MTNYCNDSTRAIITILNPKQIVRVNAPVNIELIEASIEIYVHDTRQPINKTFSRTINDIVLNPSIQTYNNGSVNNPDQDCPIPQISGKSILSDFDNYYADNTGTCSYNIYLGMGLRINGKFFDSKDGQFEVACGDECPDGYLRCECNEYPGYCCIPCSEIRNGIASATAMLRGING